MLGKIGDLQNVLKRPDTIARALHAAFWEDWGSFRVEAGADREWGLPTDLVNREKFGSDFGQRGDHSTLLAFRFRF